MSDKNIMAKLKAFNKNFSKEKKRADELGGFSEIPDGKYLAKVSSCELKESNAGELHLVFVFEIMESAEDESLVGSKVSKWCSLEREDGPAYLMRDLKRFGIEIEDLTQLKEVADLIDSQKPELKITLKDNGKGQFTYIDSVISEIDAGEMTADEEEGDDDDEEEEGGADEVDDDADDDDSEQEEDEGDDEAEEEVSLEKGMTVNFTWKGKTLQGTIKEIIERDGIVKVSADGKLHPVGIDAISIPEAEEEEAEEVEEDDEPTEEEEAPTPKKAAPAKAKPAAKKVAGKTKPVAKKKGR